MSVFRKAEEERLRNLPRPAARNPNRGPGQRPMTDLDRFLEEARRRRDQGQRPAQTIEIAQAVPVKRPPRPLREPRRQPATRSPERRSDYVPTVRRSASERRTETSLAPLIAPPQPIVEAVLVEAISEDEKARLSGLPAVIQAPVPPVAPLGGVLVHRARRVSPIAAQLPALLRNPQTTAAAFVLRKSSARPSVGGSCTRRTRWNRDLEKALRLLNRL